MNICWEKGKVRAREVYDESLKEKKRGYLTVRTMLDRMVTKGFLEREKFGHVWLYKPAVSKAKAIGCEIESFVNTVLNKSFTPLVSHLAEKGNLSLEEIEAMKKIVEEYEEDN